MFMAKLEAADPASLTVAVVYAPGPRQTREWQLELAPASTVAEALQKSGIFNEFPELATGRLPVGIWGQKCSLRQRLSDHDRVEIYRALRVDPKTARRERFHEQGAKRPGLFTKIRDGGKAGY